MQWLLITLHISAKIFAIAQYQDNLVFIVSASFKIYNLRLIWESEKERSKKAQVFFYVELPGHIK